MKIISKTFRSFLYTLLLCLCAKNVSTICPEGYVDVTGVCVQQSSTCPVNFYLVNGMCFPNYQGSCQPAEVFVNGKCCSTQCLQSCAGQAYCACCTVSLTISPHDLTTPAPNIEKLHPVQPTPCPNTQPSPSQPAPCPTTQPCPTQPCPTQPCPTQPAPCFNSQPCPTQPVPCPPTQLCPIQPAPCPTQTSPCSTTQPCPTQVPCALQPVVLPICLIYPMLPPCAPTTTQTPPPTTTITTATTSKPTTTPAPAPIKECPPGTIPVGKTCRLIYCGRGYYKDNRCVQTVCPAGTIWTGIKCAPPEPITQNIVFTNTVHTHFNRNKSDIIVNNVNNFTFNNTIELSDNEGPSPCDEEGCDETTTAPPTTPRKCCNVLTPRICKPSPSNSQWNCYTRRYRRCGDFCVAPTIYLKAPGVRNVDPYLIMPPDNQISSCRQSSLCAESINYYDCSGCVLGIAESCSSYCYRNSCLTRGCVFYDQRNYCQDSPGGYGCQQQDGCFDDWCDGGNSY